MSIAIVKSDVHILVNILIAHLEKQGLDSLDDNSRYILENVNLNMCYLNRNDIHAKLFSTLEKLENTTKEDFRICLHLLKDSTSKQINHGTIPVHLFCLQEYWDLSFNASFEKMATCESVTNLYLFFDGLYTKLRQVGHEPGLEITSSIVDRIIAAKERRGWSNMGFDYVNNIFSSSVDASKLADIVKKSDKLVTKTDGLNVSAGSVILCEYMCAEFIQNMFQKDGYIEFRVSDLAEQKLMLSRNTIKKNDPETFLIKCNMVGAIDDRSIVPKLHFALEAQNDDEHFVILPISWCGKPSCDVAKKFWNWGYIAFHANNNLKLNKYNALVGSGGLNTSYKRPIYIRLNDDRCRFVAYTIN